MKKNILVLVCIIISTFYTQAQTNQENPKDKNIRFGLRIGYEFQANDSNLEYKLKIPYIGVYSDIKLSEKLSLQIELNLRSEKRENLLNNGSRVSVDELYWSQK